LAWRAGGRPAARAKAAWVGVPPWPCASPPISPPAGEGACAHIDADLREPGKILAAAADTLDFAKPVAVMLVAVLQLIGDADDPAGIAGRLMAAGPPGSFLVISHPASDLDAGLDTATRQFNQSGGERATNRDQAAVTRLFDGCEPLEPGVVRVSEWRPASELDTARNAAVWAGVARKP